MRVSTARRPTRHSSAWLESATHEITGEIEAGAGRRLGVRVFVREPGARRCRDHGACR